VTSSVFYSETIRQQGVNSDVNLLLKPGVNIQDTAILIRATALALSCTLFSFLLKKHNNF